MTRHAPIPPCFPLTRSHVATLTLATLTCLAMAHPSVSHFDAATLRPRDSLAGWVVAVGRATNRPVRQGLLHAAAYAVELGWDRLAGRRHVGQRLTTLWIQVAQHGRWGQHVQMQLETLAQVCDASARSKAGMVAYPLPARVGMAALAVGMLAQVALTSVGWHSLHEQAVGVALGLGKLAFDYTATGSKINDRVGFALGEAVHWLGGFLAVSAAYGVHGVAALHPTVMATLLFVGGLLTALVVLLVARVASVPSLARPPLVPFSS